MKARFLALAGALLLAIPVVQAQDRFAGRVESVRALRVAPEVAAVSGVSFSIGHLKIDLTSGKAAPVMVGSERIGIYFRGKGTLQYEAEATELPVTSHNVRKMTDQKIEGNTIRGSFEELLLVTRNVALPEIAPAAGESLQESFTKHLEQFGRLRDTPVVHQFVLSELSFPSKKYVAAQFAGGGDDLVYFFDEGDTGREMLQKLRGVDTSDSTIKRWLFPVTLSSRMISGNHKEVTQVPFTLTALDYTLVGDGDNAKLTVTETIKRGAGQNALRFGMNDLAFAKMNTAPRRFTVNSIVDESGRALPFDHSQGSLLVGVESLKGETIKLTFDISGDFLIRPNNDNFWQLGTDNWFPQPDLGGQFYTIHSIVKVRKPFIPFAPGKTVARREEGEFNVVENVVEQPVQFEVVHAGKYDVYEETRAGVTIRVASYAGKNERASKQLINLAFQVMDYYQWFLGPFPFPEVNIIQVNAFGHAQAPPGTIFVTNEAFNSTLGEINKLFSQGINERFAHEIGHFYWGHVIKMPSVEEQWLTESFAEYSAALVLKKYQGNDVYKRLIAHWKADAKEATRLAPIAYANRISGDPLNAMISRQALLYSKGPYLLYKLHQELGDDAFLTFLKSYQKSRRWQFSNTAETAALLQFVTKKDYTPFFDQYYWGTGMPE